MILDGGHTHQVTVRRPGRSDSFHKIDVPLRSRGAIIDGTVGAAPAMLMRASDLLLLASGTATLEASLIGTPMIAIYRVSGTTITTVRAAIRLGLMDSETLALPNLLLGRMVIPEIRQEELSAERLADEAAALLRDRARLTTMRDELATVRDTVDGQGTVACVADLVLSMARKGAPEGGLAPLVLEGDSA